ncbi:MAG: hypothetical protein IK005_12300, partial [Paludibacteraceae bacterium]|nr:hypothetical protein [Paludibacteraceae bacterium]
KWIKENKKDLPQVTHYNNVDEKGVYSSSGNSSNPHPGGYMYDIIHPITHKPVPKPKNGWRWPLTTFQAYNNMHEIEWGKDETTQPHVKKRLETSTEYLRTMIYEDNRGTTIALSEIFEGKKIFDNPKPQNILSRIIDFSSSKFSTILDFFAGSGTTLHATMKLNAEDGGHRQCILVQQREGDNNICENVTYERNRRVMCGYTNAKGEQVEGLGGRLKYYRTAFVGKNASHNATDADRVELAHKAGYLLSMGENTLEEIEHTDTCQFFADNKENATIYTAIFFTENYAKLPEFVAKIEKLQASVETKDTLSLPQFNVYIFCWGTPDIFESEFDDLRGIALKAIPQPILDVYKSINQ